MKNLLAELNGLGVKLRLDGDELHVNAPQGVLTDALRQRLRLHKEDILCLLRSSDVAEQALPSLAPDAGGRAEPFPLTDLQHAYWLGRDSTMEMGGVATHLYVELDGDALDIERLNHALCRMIDRHDMLRAVVGGDGMQRILPVVPRYRIGVTDVSGATPEAAERAALATRDELSHQVLPADRWPLFDVRATLLPAARVRLHVSLDLLILDAWSIFLFFKEWHALYQAPESARPAFDISFRDYVLAEQRIQGTPAHQRALAYWMERVERLPAAPDLPLRAALSARKSPRFSRREARLDKARWEQLRGVARTRGLTPSGLLLACYAEVLARWSTTPHFTLNVTVSNRLPLHQQVNSLLGDFTALLMQEVDLRDSGATFLQRARRLQQQFLADVDHREVSGVTVMREWAKRRGSGLQATMPVVFSSGLTWSGEEEPGDLEQFGKKVYSVSQTSQVWLDHHVMELNGDLVCIWDAADAVFEEGVLDAMFDAYRTLIERLAGDEALWDSRDIVPLPAAMQQRRDAANDTQAALPQQRLHAGFVGQAHREPHAVALLSPARTMLYGELLAESTAVADWLLRSGVRPGQPVAIVMRKGWEQVVAVLGTLLAGGAYLPVDADLPAQRQLELLRIGESAHILAQPGAVRAEIDTGAWRIHVVRAGATGDYGTAHARSLAAPLDEPAYVIFTSGTTGVPKGVVTSHRGAANTVDHINRLYGVGEQDRVLAVSSLSFDLSVYDIFGLLAAGGALVLPDYGKGHDPVHWRDLAARYRVTLWNSAPQLLRMLMDSVVSGQAAGQAEEAPLRTVLLSGDFIPLDLPDRVRRHYTQAQVVSLGGATEASVWSIYHPVREVDPAWASIPYGKALPNQTVAVYDQAFRVCPDHVKGRIHIGGIGLAIGYWRDKDKTAARFVTHPRTGERLYDTGDLGRYAPDGNIVILGRDDGQVKIRGHRVELGEIEAVLRRHPSIRNAIVALTDGAAEMRQLVAYIEFSEHGLALPAQAVQHYLAEYLPDYMVPRIVAALDRIPVSANGKIDHQALPVVSDEVLGTLSTRVAPRNEVEQAILEVWSRVVSGLEIGVTDNFFDIGGDSVLATQLVRELNAGMAFGLEMHELFEHLTIESLAMLYQQLQAAVAAQPAPETTAPVAPQLDSSGVMADVAGAIACVEALEFSQSRRRQPDETSGPGAVFLTGGTGWIGVHVLAELLSSTRARIYCLVRSSDKAAGMARLRDSMAQFGIVPDAAWMERIEPVPGDLTAPGLGLDAAAWQSIAEGADAIYHLGASLNVLADYATHKKNNVDPMTTIVKLAVDCHCKPIFFLSPMTVCRRRQAGRLLVLHEERVQPGPDGLLTAYAQSKWAGEQILAAVAGRGGAVKIYRTSHALPPASTGQAKPHDTYMSVLNAACAAGVVPDWPDSCFYGMPVDVLARLLVENSLGNDGYSGVVHLDNRTPPSLESVVGILLGGDQKTPRVARGDWKNRCREAATRLKADSAILADVLFADRRQSAAVDDMFAAHPLDTHYFDSRGLASRLADLTPASYWRRLRSHFE